MKMVRGDSVICKVACIHKPHFGLGYLGVLLNVPWEWSVYKKESSGSFFIFFLSIIATSCVLLNVCMWNVHVKCKL